MRELKVQARPGPDAANVRLTESAKPPTALRETVEAPVSPVFIVTSAGADVIVKSCTPKATLTECETGPLEPVTVTV